MDTTNWVITIGTPVVNPADTNVVNVPVTYAYNDGTNSYSFNPTFVGVMSQANLQELIVQNFPTYQSHVDVLINTPVGQVDLTQLFPVPATPVVATLAVAKLAEPITAQTTETTN